MWQTIYYNKKITEKSPIRHILKFYFLKKLCYSQKWIKKQQNQAFLDNYKSNHFLNENEIIILTFRWIFHHNFLKHFTEYVFDNQFKCFKLNRNLANFSNFGIAPWDGAELFNSPRFMSHYTIFNLMNIVFKGEMLCTNKEQTLWNWSAGGHTLEGEIKFLRLGNSLSNSSPVKSILYKYPTDVNSVFLKIHFWLKL